MRLLPSGTNALLVEMDDLDAVLGLYAALLDEPLQGVVDLVPAARTLLVVTDPGQVPEVCRLLRSVRPAVSVGLQGAEVDVPVVYDGADLTSLAALLGLERDELVRRHTACTWTVGFCGFTAGFGYATSPDWPFEVPRLTTPRTSVPAGSVAVAGAFSAVYPSPSPGGWQLLGRTDLAVFDLTRDPAVLLRPGVRVRYVDTS